MKFKFYKEHNRTDEWGEYKLNLVNMVNRNRTIASEHNTFRVKRSSYRKEKKNRK